MTSSLNTNIMSSQSEEGPSFVVQRKAYDQKRFNSIFQAVPSRKRNPLHYVRNALSRSCSSSTFHRHLIRIFPFLHWMRHYDFKGDLVSDIIAGLTITIFQVPQGMAYGQLAGVLPVYGLYTSFFPVLVYALMGTSRQLSVGTYAVMSLMTAGVLNKLGATTDGGELDKSALTHINATVVPTSDDNIPPTAISVAITLTVLSGIIQFFFGVLRLGSLSVFLSPQLVSGFTCGAAFHVMTSQVNLLLGYPIPGYTGAFNIVRKYIAIFGQLNQTNYVTLGLSISALILMVLVKEGLGPYLRKKTRVPFPIELIMLIVGTLICKYMDLRDRYGVNIVGNITTGLPSPSVPPAPLFPRLIVDSLVISIVSITSSLSMAKIFSRKYKYPIDCNQELIALGAANIFSSFFSCIPATASLSRCSVQDAAGGKTQLVSLINCVGMLIVLLVLAPALYYVPSSVLSAIIVVSLKGLLMQVVDLRRYWRSSKSDALIWFLTFASVVFLDVDIGLGVGVLFSLLLLIYRSQRPKTFVLGEVGSTEIYVPLKKYLKAREISGLKIFRFAGPLHFANAEFFVTELARSTGVASDSIIQGEQEIPGTGTCGSFKTFRKSDSKLQLVENSANENVQSYGITNIAALHVQEEGSSGPDTDDRRDQGQYRTDAVTHIILDCSGFSFVDTYGATTLKQMIQDYGKVGVTIYLADCPANITGILEREGVHDNFAGCPIYPTLHDAVLHALHRDA